jgi:hypothetical protein
VLSLWTRNDNYIYILDIMHCHLKTIFVHDATFTYTFFFFLLEKKKKKTLKIISLRQEGQELCLEVAKDYI